MAKVVLIGAGLTGISTAYHLEKNDFFEFKLFEKEATPGGLCRSVSHDGFTFDFTGHLLHASDSYFYDLITSIIGLENLNAIDRKSFIYSHETFTKYPFQINLFGLPPRVIVECITGFLNRTHNPNPVSFREWVLAQFGQGFGNQFFFDYQEKIFAHPIDEITASWTGRFVPQTSLEQILYGSLSDQKNEAVGYNARFLYPKKGGIQSWVHTLADQITQPIHTNFCVKAIDMQKKVVTFTNGHTEPYDILINTMPLDQLLSLSIESSSSSLKQAVPHLKCNQVVNFNIGVNRPDLSDKHWVYFPEKQYPFYRIGFWHNFSKSMAPEGCGSLYGEFAYRNQSPEWIEQTLDASLKAAKKLFTISDDDIITQKTFTIPHAYVTYDHWRDTNLSTLLDRLREHTIYSVGRYGAWKYSSMQEAVLDGRDTAHTIMQHITKKVPIEVLSHSKKEISYE